MDTDRLGARLHAFASRAKEVDPAAYKDMLSGAESGWTPVEGPENYRWFLIKDFPLKDFQGVSIRSIIGDLKKADAEVEQAQHDRIVDLLERGAASWPAFVTASGVILDGYHRIAAHKTLKHKAMDVVVAVERPGSPSERGWDKAWNGWFPV